MSASKSTRHPWTLTGPWYRWSEPGVAEAGRGSKPAIQQYAGFSYAAEFLAEPQRSLIPREQDYVHRLLANPDNPPPAEGAVPHAPPKPFSELPFAAYLRERTQVRKLYQAIHGYSYLVSVELHCDLPGLPSVDADKVEEAGFVIRRLSAEVLADADGSLEKQASEALAEIKLAEQQLTTLERTPQGRIRGAAGLVLQRKLNQPVTKTRKALLEDHAAGKLKLDDLAAAGAFDLRTQGWIPDEHDPQRGAWVELDDATPGEELSEAVFPLYRLSPDPADEDHSARGRTLYYGVVPTGGRDVETGTAAPRFDDRHLYEIRCFVRRKHEKPGCRGELVWSEPSVGYRVAPDADPEAGDRLPISISVPSFNELKALADRMTTGGAGGVRIVQPPDSVLPFTGDLGDDLGAGARTGIGQICFISILLLFIIALFLAFLFLPIIVFVFQLFFLLRLKFCIPPAISLDLDLAVELKAELDLSFEAGASVDFAAVLEAKGEINPGDDPHDWADARLFEIYGDCDLYDALTDASLATKMQRILDLGCDFRASVEPELAAELKLEAWSSDPAPEPGSNVLAPALPSAAPLSYYARVEVPT